jgi:hypothetical protein
MSYARIALRLAALEALCPQTAIEANTGYPTYAGVNVFDTRLRPLTRDEQRLMRYALSVYVNDDKAETAHRGGIPFKRTLGLEVVLMVIGASNEEAMLEAHTDALDGQVRYALLYGAKGFQFRQLTGNLILNIESETERGAEEAMMSITRVLRFECEVPDDQFDLNPESVATGAARIPEPLFGVLAGLSGGAFAQSIGVSLQNGAPLIPVLPALAEVGLIIDPDPPSATGDTIVASVTLPT